MVGWFLDDDCTVPDSFAAAVVTRLLRQGELEGFVESSVDIDSIPFKDARREKQRLLDAQRAKEKKREQQQEQEQEDPGDRKKARSGSGGGGGSNATNKAANNAANNATASQRLTASKRRTLESRQELADLEDDYALWKKLKKGKITQAEYDAAMELNDDDDGGGGLVELALAKKKARKKKKTLKSGSSTFSRN